MRHSLGMESKLNSGLVVSERHLTVLDVVDQQRKSHIGQTTFQQHFTRQFRRPVHLNNIYIH